MLRVEEKISFKVGYGFDRAIKMTKLRCERCYYTIKSDTFHARTCPECRAPIPNTIRMQLFPEDRIKYHFGII